MEHKHNTQEEHLEETAIGREDPDESTAEEITRIIKKEEKKEWMLPASILVAAVLISAAFIYSGGGHTSSQTTDKSAQEVAGPKITDGDTPLGNKDAKVTIIEFGDFQCPYCGKFFNDVQPFIKKAFIDTGKAKFVYKPLAFLGPESENAATAVECAQEQGKFWEMHDAIFSTEYKDVERMIAGTIKSSENNGNLTLDLFTKLAGNIGLNQDAFTTCYNSGKEKDLIAAHLKEAQDVMSEGISTPSVYVNGKKVDPRVLYDQTAFTALVDAAAKQ